MWLALSGGGYDQIELSTLAETQLKDRLAQAARRRRASCIAGERRYSMRVWIDNDAAHRAPASRSPTSPRRCERENVDIPSGRIEGSEREFTVRTPRRADDAGASTRR